jgi:hypothetical protein
MLAGFRSLHTIWRSCRYLSPFWRWSRFCCTLLLLKRRDPPLDLDSYKPVSARQDIEKQEVSLRTAKEKWKIRPIVEWCFHDPAEIEFWLLLLDRDGGMKKKWRQGASGGNRRIVSHCDGLCNDVGIWPSLSSRLDRLGRMLISLLSVIGIAWYGDGPSKQAERM